MTSETKRILDGWEAIEPRTGFADRVLGACEGAAPRVAPKRRSRIWIGALAAVAAVIALGLRVSPAAREAHEARVDRSATAAHFLVGDDLDLGAPRD